MLQPEPRTIAPARTPAHRARYVLRRSWPVAALLAVTVAVACVEDDLGPTTVTEVVLTAKGPTTLLAGDTLVLSAVALGSGRLMLVDQPAVTWSVTDPNVATVNQETGTVTAGEAGTTQIKATVGGVSETITITVTPQPLTVVGDAYALAITDLRAFRWTQADGPQDIGTLPGGNTSQAWGVNNRGQVVGWSTTTGSVRHAFVWRRQGGQGIFTDIGTLPGDVSSEAYGVNDNGQVVGASFSASGVKRAFIWTKAQGMTELPKLQGADSAWAQAINNAGIAVGASGTASKQVHAVVWNAQGGVQDLGTLGGNESVAYATGVAGEVVGASRIASGARHAFLYNSVFGMKDLGTLGGNDAKAFGIGSAGIVGWSLTADGFERGFLIPPGGQMQDIFRFGNASFSWADDANFKGNVVGWSLFAGRNRAFLWSSSTGMINLGVPTGMNDSRAHAINNGS